MHDTPLGQIVRIRAENDKAVIEKFSPYEKHIRSQWAAFRREQAQRQLTDKQALEAADYFEKLFAGMFGGESR